MAAVGVYNVAAPRTSATHANAGLGLMLIAAAAAMIGLTSLRRRYTSWSLTSDRLIERRGFISPHRRGKEPSDVGSIGGAPSVMQTNLQLGHVNIPFAATAGFLITPSHYP